MARHDTIRETPPPPPLGLGSIVAGVFVLEEKLREGGMGSVWRARHLRLEAPCALKFMSVELVRNEICRARFEREAKAAARVRSGNVVQILDYGVEHGVPYLAMEYLEGEDLGTRLDHVGKLGVRDTLKILDQIASALDRAHGAGVVHRDLKPENVFLAREGLREVVKVIDFGIAHDVLAMGRQTQTGTLVGTPGYMSPEQARGSTVDHRTDLWSLAVVAFECLTGHAPFDADSLADLLVQVLVGDLPRPTEHCPDLPRAVDGWWAKAAARDPEDRFATAAEAVAALELALCSEAASAPTLPAPPSEDPSSQPRITPVVSILEPPRSGTRSRGGSAAPSGSGSVFGPVFHSHPTSIAITALGIGAMVTAVAFRFREAHVLGALARETDRQAALEQPVARGRAAIVGGIGDAFGSAAARAALSARAPSSASSASSPAPVAAPPAEVREAATTEAPRKKKSPPQASARPTKIGGGAVPSEPVRTAAATRTAPWKIR